MDVELKIEINFVANSLASTGNGICRIKHPPCSEGAATGSEGAATGSEGAATGNAAPGGSNAGFKLGPGSRV